MTGGDLMTAAGVMAGGDAVVGRAMTGAALVGGDPMTGGAR